MRKVPYPDYWTSPGLMYERFPVSKADIVIDVGFGPGHLIFECARLGAKVIATDILPEPVAQLSQQLQAIGASYEAFVSDANPLPLADEAVTRVISTQVIEHVDDPDAFLRELVRIGRPGALYFLATPDAAGEHMMKKIAHPSAFEKPNHIRIIERDDFAALVTRAGLVIEHRAYRGFSDLFSWLMFWTDAEAEANALRERWDELWDDILLTPRGRQLEGIVDAAWPKDQIIVARKP